MINIFLNLSNSYDLSIVLIFLTLCFISYFLFYFLGNWQAIKIKHLFIAIIILNSVFILIPFITSNDLYSYIFQTRILPIFGKNPYLVPYDMFRYDILYSSLKTIWSQETTLHGPLFLLIGGLVNLIAKNNLIQLVLLFKIVLISANILSAWFIYLITKSKKALFLYGLNPLVIFELAGNAHADSLLILFLLISIFNLKINKPIKGQIFLVASGLVKYSTFMLTPFQFLYVRTKNIKKIPIMIFSGLLLIIVIYLPFWNGIKIFNYLLSYYNGQYTSPSLGIALGSVLLKSYATSFLLNTVIFFSAFVFLCLRLLQSKPKFSLFIFSSFILYWIYLLTKLSLVLAWDLTPLIAMGSLCIIWRKYQKIVLISILFTTLYSLALYYFIH